MSSHHIVREKQEPALLILGLDHFSDELLGQLLEWSPTVITTADTAEKLNVYGIKINWIISTVAANNLQADVKILPAGNGAIAHDAINYLVVHGFPAVNIITDEFKLTDYEPFADKIDLVIFYNHKKIYAAKPGFSKWKPAGEVIELLTLPDNFSTTGLKKLNQHRYITTNDAFFTLQFNGPFLFIAEEL